MRRRQSAARARLSLPFRKGLGTKTTPRTTLSPFARLLGSGGHSGHQNNTQGGFRRPHGKGRATAEWVRIPAPAPVHMGGSECGEIVAGRYPRDDARQRILWILTSDKRPPTKQWKVEVMLSIIAENIRTQDNRATSDPIFIVQQKCRLYGMDPQWMDDGGVWIWTGGHSEEATEEELALIEKEIEENGEPGDGWTYTGYIDQWVFVTACFTEKGCQDYIEANRHNLGETRIYAATAYGNHEFIEVRNFLKANL